MRKFLSRGWLLACLITILSLSNAQGRTLIVGILPTMSPQVLLTNYQPLRNYLEQTLKRPVELVTATNFATFYSSTMAGDYDIVVTAAHLGRLAQTKGGYIPLVTFKSTNRALLVTAKSSALKSIQDVHGHAIAALDRFALITNQALFWLEGQGLHEGTDFRLLETSSHNSSVYSVLSGESMLAIISPAGWGQLPPNVRDKVRIFISLPAVPGLVLLANPRLAHEVPNLKSALLDFSPNFSEGKQFFDATHYEGIRKIAPEEMKSLDAYTPYLQQHLGH